MPITGTGWELHVIRHSEQRRPSNGKRRTVGTYQVYHDGKAQDGTGLSGTIAETRGPGANAPENNNRRIEAGRYPLYTQDGAKYVTNGYKDSESPSVKPKPGLELKDTGERTEILIHPGIGFVASVGCFNPCTSLPDDQEMIDYLPSRRRVIAIIDDLRKFIKGFPDKNGRRIEGAFVVVDGEPEFPDQ